MNNIEDVLVYVYGFFSLLGIGAIVGLFKAVDWIIGQKYVSHEKCEKCRSEIYKTIATDHSLLAGLDGKVDLICQALNIKAK